MWKEEITTASGSVEIVEFEVPTDRDFKGMKAIPVQIVGEKKFKLYEKKFEFYCLGGSMKSDHGLLSGC